MTAATTQNLTDSELGRVLLTLRRLRSTFRLTETRRRVSTGGPNVSPAHSLLDGGDV